MILRYSSFSIDFWCEYASYMCMYIDINIGCPKLLLWGGFRCTTDRSNTSSFVFYVHVLLVSRKLVMLYDVWPFFAFVFDSVQIIFCFNLYDFKHDLCKKKTIFLTHCAPVTAWGHKPHKTLLYSVTGILYCSRHNVVNSYTTRFKIHAVF